MKKSLIFTLLFLFSLSINVCAKDIGIVLNDKPLQFTQSTGAPFADENSRTQVPLRVTMESAGAKVDWDQSTQTAIVARDGIIVKVPMNKKYIYVNDVKKEIDTQSVVVNERIYLPIRFVLEAFGDTVEWDQTNYNVVIQSKGQPSINITSNTELNATEIAQKYSNTVFCIKAMTMSGNGYSQGSGFFISPNGLAITNNHVIVNSLHFIIETTDNKKYTDIDIIDVDEKNDLALLKINGVSNMPYVTLGNSDVVKQGEKVFAIGNPLGLKNTLSEGIISNISRQLGESDYIQITTPIDHGSSGGALFNTKGEVIGVTSAGMNSNASLNFVVPSNYINKLNKNSKDSLISYGDETYLDEHDLDFGVFANIDYINVSGAANSGSIFTFEYDMGDFEDNKEFGTTASDNFAYTMFYYGDALEEAGFKYSEIGDADYYSHPDGTIITINADYNKFKIFITLTVMPHVYPIDNSIADLGWYLGLPLYNEGPIGDSYMYVYQYNKTYSVDSLLNNLDGYMKYFINNYNCKFIPDQLAYLFENNKYSIVVNFDEKCVYVDILEY